MSELANIQKWLTSIMVRPGRLSDKIRAADATYGVDSSALIVSSEKLGAQERIGIYARGYVLRLMECMRADYPMVQNLMGEELFDVFAGAYLVQLPAHAPSLFELGKNFPAFLEASQPKTEVNEMFALPLELSKLERLRAEVFRSKGLEKTSHEMPDGDPLFYLFASGGFHPSPCLRLMRSEFDLLPFVKTVEKGGEAPVPGRKECFIAVCRRNYAPNMQELEPWQWHFLQELEVSGQREAAKKVAQILDMDHEALSAELMLWLPVALQRGYIFWKEE